MRSRLMLSERIGTICARAGRYAKYSHGSRIFLSARRTFASAGQWPIGRRLQFRLLAYHLSLVDRYPSCEAPTLRNAEA